MSNSKFWDTLSMSKHFLTEIKINKFKSFEEFTANKFKRVNLLGGRNNIGKTSFMEACYINLTSNNLNLLYYALCSVKSRRENLNILMDYVNGKHSNDKNLESEQKLLEFQNGYSVNSNISSSKFSVNESDGTVVYNFQINDKKIRVNKNEFAVFFEHNSAHQFLDSFGCSYGEIEIFYAKIQESNQEEYLNQILNQFDNQIKGFKIINGIPKCNTNGNWIELNELGDGARHLITIITAIVTSKDGYIFIDEVDNGIHYTFLDKLWQEIFDISERLNCQVFATTHSKECIEAFNRANQKDDGVYLEFYRNEKNKKIEIKHREYQQLDYSLNTNGEFRGE